MTTDIYLIGGKEGKQQLNSVIAWRQLIYIVVSGYFEILLHMVTN